MIHARGLRCVYGRGRRAVCAVEDFDFEVAPGEVVGLLGPNGSGKSTTLRAVLGLLAPAAGHLQVFGGKAGRREARARTGFVPEEARRFGRMTGRETVDLFAQLQGVGPRRERRQRVEAAMHDVGLEARALDRRVQAYSRGMARRLALAAAWVHRPDLLVLDEPTGGLDPFGCADLLHVITRHASAGGAALVSTHDRVAAQEGCHRLLVLDAGHCVASGFSEELLAHDDSPSLKQLLERVQRA